MNEAENVGCGMKTGAELLVSGLKKAGIELVLGIPGGTVIPLYDALYEGRPGLVLIDIPRDVAEAAAGAEAA